MRVLGIDCGTEYTGYGVVEQAEDGCLSCRAVGAIQLNSREPLPARLYRIFCRLSELIQQHRPDDVAIEDVFYAVNVKSALKLGQVRGVAMLAAASAGLPVAEYAPLAIKSAVVGYGRAEKSQVQQMVSRLLGLESLPQPSDAADALAIAICHLHTAATWRARPHILREMIMRVGRLMLVCILTMLPWALTAQVPNLHPQQTLTPEPIVSFSLELAGSVPPYYSISVESTGEAAYRSSPTAGGVEGDPYITKFVVSQAARTRIFELAKKLHYFKGDYEYRKGHLANTGAKTLYYTDAKTNNSTTYNYSSNQEIQELTRLFQGMSTTLEFGRRLQYYYDHQKLGLDDELKRMDQMAQEGALEELQAVAPILHKIADDPQVMHIDQQHAHHLLQMAAATPQH